MKLLDLLTGHENEKFYLSSIGQVVTYLGDTGEYITVVDKRGQIYNLGKNGETRIGGECMLFPDRNQRSWTVWEYLVSKKKFTKDFLQYPSRYADIQKWLRESKNIDIGAFRCSSGDAWVGYYSLPGQDMEVIGKLQDTYEEAFWEALEEVFRKI